MKRTVLGTAMILAMTFAASAFTGNTTADSCKEKCAKNECAEKCEKSSRDCCIEMKECCKEEKECCAEACATKCEPGKENQ